MRFYPLYLKLYEKSIISMSAVLYCEFRSSWAKSRVGTDCFEISVPGLPCILIFMLLSLI